MKKNKKFLTVLCCGFLSLVVALGGLLSFKMGKIRPKNVVASADEVSSSYTLTINDIYFTGVYTRNGVVSSDLFWCSFSASFSCIDNVFSITPRFSYFTNGSPTVCGKYINTAFVQQNIYTYPTPLPFGNNLGYSRGDVRMAVTNADLTTANSYFYFNYQIDQGFNCNVESVSAYVEASLETTYKWLVLHYTDNLNNSAYLRFPVLTSFVYGSRTYYFKPSSSSEAYDYGFEQGKQQGIREGYKPAYDEGVADGKIIGDAQGYQRGIADANDYSFLSLMTAVADSPIATLRGIFDFEILGFNMYQFVCSILTICVVVFVIKLFV